MSSDRPAGYGQVANARHRKLRKEAEKKGRTPSQNLRHCAIGLCLWPTPPLRYCRSISFTPLSPQVANRTSRDRFKTCLYVLRIHSSNTTKEYRLKCEIYGKLLMAVLIHGIHSSVNTNRWLAKKTEVRFDKLYKRIQERAFSLQNILITVSTAVKQFLREINRLATACIKTRQPSRKTTLELLEDIHAFLLP